MTYADASFDVDRFRDMLLDSASVGLAILRPPTFEAVLVNTTFEAWFPELMTGEKNLADLLPTDQLQSAYEQVKAHGVWRKEVDIKPKRRPITLLIEATLAQGLGEETVIIQCQNISKIKELEFMIESYSKMIERQNREITKEKDRVEKLLLNIMPRTVYDEWKEFGVTTPQRFDEATVLMLDFVGFTQMSIAHDPIKLISELNDIFTSFDRIVEQFSCERLKTIGDAYMAVCGLPEANPDHAHNLAAVALRFVRFLQKRNQASEFEWRCRIGLNTGPVIGSVVGIQKYVYDIFGPGVNLAARLEPMCGPMEILVSDNTARRIKDRFRMTDRGVHDIRGFGETRVHCLDGEFKDS